MMCDGSVTGACVPIIINTRSDNNNIYYNIITIPIMGQVSGGQAVGLLVEQSRHRLFSQLLWISGPRVDVTVTPRHRQTTQPIMVFRFPLESS